MRIPHFAYRIGRAQICVLVSAVAFVPTSRAADTMTNSFLGAEPAGTNGLKSSAPTKTLAAPDNSLSHADRHFLEKAGQVGQNDVRLARLAADRASDPRVKSLAEQMMMDHQKSNDELALIASTKGVVLSAQDHEDHRFKSLSNKTGTEFDRKFVSHMIDDHDDALSLFERASRSNDADVAAFAAKSLSMLEDHLTEERTLEASLKR